MFNIGLPELIIILTVGILVVGPKRLPNLAKALGKGLREFRKASSDFKEEVTKLENFSEDDLPPKKEAEENVGTGPDIQPAES